MAKVVIILIKSFPNDGPRLIGNGKCFSGDRPRKLYNERSLNLPLGAELITGNIWYSGKPGISYHILTNHYSVLCSSARD